MNKPIWRPAQSFKPGTRVYPALKMEEYLAHVHTAEYDRLKDEHESLRQMKKGEADD